MQNKLTAEVFYVKNSNTNENRKNYGNLSFYLVLALCAVMIGVSCWFAYTQTADNLTIRLDSALDSANDAAARLPETGISPIPQETAMTSAGAAAYVPQTVNIQPEIAPTQAAELQEAAVIQPETHAESTAETTTETIPADAPAAYPIVGEVLGAFSNGELVKSATTGVWQTHNGIDIAAAAGDEVRAMADGVVEAVEEDPLWGVSVTIDHQNGVRSRYCNLNAGLSVNTGDTVTCGMVIGAVGNTADMESAMPSHLHFEVMQGASYVDPAAYIQE